jgi:hypothetical protein
VYEELGAAVHPTVAVVPEMLTVTPATTAGERPTKIVFDEAEEVSPCPFVAVTLK